MVKRSAGGAEKEHILLFLPTLTFGGAERQTLQLRDLLSRRGYKTSLYIHGKVIAQEMYSARGAETPVHFDLRGMSDPIGWIKLWFALRKTKPDVIFCVNQAPLIVAIVLRCLGATRARVSCIFHTTYLQEKERARFFLFRWALRLADAFVCVSLNQSRLWLARGLRSRRVRVIQNGIDLHAFRPDPEARAKVRHELAIAADEIVVGLVAAFRPEKNHALLLEAVQQLVHHGVQIRALLVGTGPTKPETEKLAEKLGLSPFVSFVGAQSDVRSWIAACDMGVLCSNAETFPLSALEFLSTGLPMILPALGGAPEIVEDGVNGFLFEPGSTTALVAAIRRLIDPDAYTRITANVATTTERFSDDRMAEAYEQLIDELVLGEAPNRSLSVADAR